MYLMANIAFVSSVITSDKKNMHLYKYQSYQYEHNLPLRRTLMPKYLGI